MQIGVYGSLIGSMDLGRHPSVLLEWIPIPATYFEVVGSLNLPPCFLLKSAVFLSTKPLVKKDEKAFQGQQYTTHTLSNPITIQPGKSLTS
jgi:hypothetical protein